jgi:hypothetical protein
LTERKKEEEEKIWKKETVYETCQTRQKKKEKRPKDTKNTFDNTECET